LRISATRKLLFKDVSVFCSCFTSAAANARKLVNHLKPTRGRYSGVGLAAGLYLKLCRTFEGYFFLEYEQRLGWDYTAGSSPLNSAHLARRGIHQQQPG
jgi:hypothetical protein